MNSRKELFTCKVCHSIFKQPVRVSCRETVCRSHCCDSNGNWLKKFTCYLCKQVHEVPKRGFSTNFHMNDFGEFQSQPFKQQNVKCSLQER